MTKTCGSPFGAVFMAQKAEEARRVAICDFEFIVLMHQLKDWLPDRHRRLSLWHL